MPKQMMWHDLLESQRTTATRQVQDVVSAQLTALAHSMIEFNCGLDRSHKYVRRMCVRYQLPIEQRAELLKHLLEIRAEKKGSGAGSGAQAGKVKVELSKEEVKQEVTVVPAVVEGERKGEGEGEVGK